jgi:hypothetical protein
MIRQSTIDKYVEKKYGLLSVLSYSHNRKPSEYFFLCRCECGTIKPMNIGNLHKGTTTSCGCIARKRSSEQLKGNTTFRRNFGESSARELFGRYKHSAKKRSILFGLSFSDFKRITISNCYYCDTPPERIHQRKLAYGHYVYNGIDRVDNAIGYFCSNCVSCCTKCNSAKNSITKEMIIKAYNFLATSVAPS